MQTFFFLFAFCNPIPGVGTFSLLLVTSFYSMHEVSYWQTKRKERKKKASENLCLEINSVNTQTYDLSLISLLNSSSLDIHLETLIKWPLLPFSVYADKFGLL